MIKSTCIDCGCEIVVRTCRKRCEKCRISHAKEYAHSYYRKRYEPKTVSVKRSCIFCGAEFDTGSTYDKKFCSEQCREQWRLVKSSRASKKRRKSIVKACPQCGKKFSPANKSFQKYCSSECLTKHDGKDSKKSFCAIDGCNRHVRARGLCSMHYHRSRRTRGLDPCEPWNERRQANYERRRALKYNNGPVEDFTNTEIFERDHWVCGICGLKVDKDLSWPDPNSASLDHIVPLIHGGTHTRGNVQCAHLVCNSMKRDRMEIPLLF